ncbi:MAG: translation initiation factor IF-3 [Lachnospiraceae bacterium]|nr:translation initiation factor IF-3 [Lachnospiraceae bacterium]
MINDQIKCPEIRVISEEGEQLGIMSVEEAMKLAENENADLIMISPKANPPVCRIMDYGKFKYEQTRREKEAKKKQKTIELKEIRLSPNTDTNDLNTKVNHIKKFLADGNKVKVTVRFRGRELAHMNVGKDILDKMAADLADAAVVDKPPKVEGRNMVMFLSEKRS